MDSDREGSAPADGAKTPAPEVRVRRIHRRDLNRVWEFLKLVFRDVLRETIEYQRPRLKKHFFGHVLTNQIGPPMPAVDRIGRSPSDTRWQRSCPRHNRFHADPCGKQQGDPLTLWATWQLDSQPQPLL